jgi:transposase
LAAGRARLRQRPKTGRPPHLDQAQWERLAEILARGAVSWCSPWSSDHVGAVTTSVQ